MKLKERSDGFWITGLPKGPDCGPYNTRKEADSDRRGMERFLRHEREEGFVTVDRAKGDTVVA